MKCEWRSCASHLLNSCCSAFTFRYIPATTEKNSAAVFFGTEVLESAICDIQRRAIQTEAGPISIYGSSRIPVPLECQAFDRQRCVGSRIRCRTPRVDDALVICGDDSHAPRARPIQRPVGQSRHHCHAGQLVRLGSGGREGDGAIARLPIPAREDGIEVRRGLGVVHIVGRTGANGLSVGTRQQGRQAQERPSDGGQEHRGPHGNVALASSRRRGWTCLHVHVDACRCVMARAV